MYFKRFCCLAAVLFLWLGVSPVFASGAVILLGTPPTTVAVFGKYEADFTVSTTSQFPFFQYDAVPPLGVNPAVGITVEGVFKNQTSGKTWTQPAFFMTDTEQLFNKDGSQYFVETDRKHWGLRFSPQEMGTFSVSIHVKDAAQDSTFDIGQFTATAPGSKGFIRVSKNDPRYFEFTSGAIYWPIGPIWGNQPGGGNTWNYTQFANSGLNQEREWMAGFGAYSTLFARWKSLIYGQGNEGFYPALFPALPPGGELVYSINYPQGQRQNISNFEDGMFGPRIVKGKRYQVKFTYKATGLAGPRNPGLLYGLVVRTSDAYWGTRSSAVAELDKFDAFERTNSEIIVPHITTNSGWTTTNTTFTAIGDRKEIFIYLDNVTAGNTPVSYFSMKEILPDGSLGAEIVRDPSADQQNVVEQRPAGFFDWQVSEAEKNGVYLKYVVHDKNDYVQNQLKSDGTWSTGGRFSGSGYFQPYNTKARWLLRQWYRYVVARWGYSTAIFSWELLNEGDPNNTLHYQTAEDFAKYMHSIDSHPHLASTSFWCCWRPTFWGSTTTYKDVDFGDIHEYSSNPQVSVTDGTYDTATWMLNMSKAVENGHTGKPTVMGEIGISTSGPIAELKSPNPGIWYHDMLWTGLAPGALFSPDYYFSSHTSQIPIKQIASVFSNFVQTLDLNKGGFVDLGATSSDPKLRIIGQKNLASGKAVAWIQNTDHTWKNVYDGITSVVSGTVSFKLRPTTSYPLSWIDTNTGAVTKSEQKNSDGAGNLSLPISNLATDIALKIGDTAPVPGDANNDGVVNALDLKTILTNYLKAAITALDQYPDSKINVFDFVTVLKRLP